MKTKQSTRASRPQTRPRYRAYHSAIGLGWEIFAGRVMWCYGLTEYRARRIVRLLNQHRKG